MNRHIQNVLSIIDQHSGITSNNMKMVENEMSQITRLQDDLQSLINQYSSAKVTNITVPWIDGRNIPFYMWNQLFQVAGQQIHSEIEVFESKLGHL